MCSARLNTKTRYLGRLPVPAMGICFHWYRNSKMSQRDQLRLIKDLGFDVIHTEESPVAPGEPRGLLAPVMAWNHIEVGKNQYDWSFLDRLVEDCQAVGLKFLHDIELLHHLPDWIAEKYPEAEFLSPTGNKIGRYIRTFCYEDYLMRCFSLAHPACRDAAADFMRKVAQRYAGSQTVVGYILVEELGLNYPHSNTWYGQDVSKPTLEGFRQYLADKYKDVKAINQRWGTRYGSFAEASSDRSIFQYHPKPHCGWQDWCFYRPEYMGRFFREVSDAIKAADPESLVIASSVDCYPNYYVVQGIRLEKLSGFDMVAVKSFSEGGVHDGLRWMFSSATIAGTKIGMSNLGTHCGAGLPTWDMVRKVFAALGMGTKWNALYAWHRHTDEDEKTGELIIYENLKNFVPYIHFLRKMRFFFGSLKPKKAEVAIMKPERADMIDFWKYHDPRILWKSHASTGQSGIWANYIANLLSSHNVHYELITEESIVNRLGPSDYKLLIVGETHLTGEVAEAIRAWVDKGGKVVLMPNAARFNQNGDEVNYFADLMAQQNILPEMYKDFAGWEKVIGFPDQASVILVEDAYEKQLSYILNWSGVKPALEFVFQPPVNNYDIGAGKKSELKNPYLKEIFVCPLTDNAGHEVYIFVRRGTCQEPLRDVPVSWGHGAATIYIPPETKPIKCEPNRGKLILPEWEDVLILSGLDITNIIS